MAFYIESIGVNDVREYRKELYGKKVTEVKPIPLCNDFNHFCGFVTIEDVGRIVCADVKITWEDY